MTEFGNIGMRLKKARMAAGFKSAREFCDKYGIPSSTYSLHETGGRSLKQKIAKKYADYLGVNIAWLLTGVGSPYNENHADEKNTLSHNEYIELLKYQGNDFVQNSLRDKTEILNGVDPLLFSEIIVKISKVLTEINIHLDTKQISKKAIEIYKDITLSSKEQSAQLTMVDLSITTFKRELQQITNTRAVNT